MAPINYVCVIIFQEIIVLFIHRAMCYVMCERNATHIT